MKYKQGMKSTKVQNPRRNKCSAVVVSREELPSARVPHTVPYWAAYHNYFLRRNREKKIAYINQPHYWFVSWEEGGREEGRVKIQ